MAWNLLKLGNSDIATFLKTRKRKHIKKFLLGKISLS